MRGSGNAHSTTRVHHTNRAARHGGPRRSRARLSQPRGGEARARSCGSSGIRPQRKNWTRVPLTRWRSRTVAACGDTPRFIFERRAVANERPAAGVEPVLPSRPRAACWAGRLRGWRRLGAASARREPRRLCQLRHTQCSARLKRRRSPTRLGYRSPRRRKGRAVALPVMSGAPARVRA